VWSLKALVDNQPQPMRDHPDNKNTECRADDHSDRS